MTSKIVLTSVLFLSIALTGCARLGLGGGGNNNVDRTPTGENSDEPPREAALESENILTLFNPPETENQVSVNRYIWAAALEVLDFLPIQTVDAFTGVIVTGYGTPPGGGRAYRATVLVDDPALEARSLKVAMQSRGGPVSASTVRAIEDAILTRARQLRVADSKF